MRRTVSGKRQAVLLALCLAMLSANAEAQRAGPTAAANTRSVAIRAEMAGVLLQSRRYYEAAAEYAVLVALDRDNIAYRVGLARALAWGKRPQAAERAILDLLELRPGNADYEAMLLSVRGQLTPSADEAYDWVRRSPRSFDYRQMLARALARERHFEAAAAQYDTLIAQQPLTLLYQERAHAHFGARNLTAAERDADVAARGIGSASAFLLQSELHRARGNLPAARAAVERARRSPRRDADVTAASARLAREEHPPVAFMPDVTEPDGWLTTNTTTGDNLGANLTTATARRGGRLGGVDGLDASLGVAARWISERSASPEAGPSAYGADVAISREGTSGEFYGRVRARAGFMYHPAADAIPDASFAANLFFRAWGAGFEVFTGPAYPSLLTLASFLPAESDSPQLTEDGHTFSLVGPIAAAEAAASWQTASISDGNRRQAFRMYARHPVSPRVALVYSGSIVSFSEASALYWDPVRSATHGVGPELFVRRQRGVSASLRVLPGGAWADERRTAIDSVPRQSSALQLSASGDVGFRADDWELIAALGYGGGRSGDYHRMDASVQLRYTP